LNNCIFCKIIGGAIPASVVYEDEHALAFMDINPVNPGHTLVVPKAHFQEVGEMDEAIGAHLFKVAMRVEKALRKSGLRCEGINILQNNGAAAFQDVMHVHLHVIPRYRGDDLKVHWGAKSAERQDLEEAAKSIKKQMTNEPQGN